MTKMPTGTSEFRKSNKKADLFRTNGNQFYSQKRFFDALIAYNQSLCHAELGTESMGLALANRSAVFLECNLYENALQNIKLAVENKYPESKHQILNKRKQKCMEQLKLQKKPTEDPWDFLKLSYTPNEQIPFIVDCLQVQCDEKYGRYITTNRALKVGDIIAIEEPFCKIIKCDPRYSTCYESNCFQRCSHCLKENFLDLYPCKGCNLTMYCSDVCKDSANNSYHNYECEIMDYFLVSGIIHIVMRTFFKALSLFGGSIVQLETFLSNIKDQTVFDFNMSNDPLNEKNKLIDTYALANNESKCDLKSYEILFLKHPKLKRMWTTNNQFITHFLTKLCHIGNQYVHGIGSWSLKIGGLSSEVTSELVNPSQLSQLIGNGIYTFSALLNHSCAPNIKRLNFEDKIILIVSRPIKENDQLFDSYRQNFNNQSKEERQAALLKDYNFLCDCDACTGNYPLNKDLEIVSEKLLNYAWKAHEQLPTLTPSQAIKKFHEICEAIEKNDKYFPCSEIIIFHECISNHLITATKPSFQFP